MRSNWRPIASPFRVEIFDQLRYHSMWQQCPPLNGGSPFPSLPLLLCKCSEIKEKFRWSSSFYVVRQVSASWTSVKSENCAEQAAWAGGACHRRQLLQFTLVEDQPQIFESVGSWHKLVGMDHQVLKMFLRNRFVKGAMAGVSPKSKNFVLLKDSRKLEGGGVAGNGLVLGIRGTCYVLPM